MGLTNTDMASPGERGAAWRRRLLPWEPDLRRGPSERRVNKQVTVTSCCRPLFAPGPRLPADRCGGGNLR